VQEFVAGMVAAFAANLDRNLAAGVGKAAAPAAQLDVGQVLWRWLKSFFKRKGSS
jgi:hypothetical protein